MADEGKKRKEYRDNAIERQNLRYEQPQYPKENENKNKQKKAKEKKEQK